MPCAGCHPALARIKYPPQRGAEAGPRVVRLGVPRTPSAAQFGPGVSLDVAGRFPG